MQPNRKIIARVPALALTVTAATLCAMTIALSRPEAVLDRSFGAGLAAAPRAGGQTAAPRSLADSPHFRLSKSEPDLVLGLAQPLRPGDRITVSSQEGEDRVLEVIDIRDLDAGITRAEAADVPRLLLVSCKMLGSDDDRIVRFIVEAGASEPATIGTHSPRAL
jgi:hypothetical protein